jgi:hypothetical protein
VTRHARVVLGFVCVFVAVGWAGCDLYKAFRVAHDQHVLRPSSWLEVPDLVLLAALIVFLRLNVSFARLAVRHGGPAEWCRIGHFWVTIACLCAAVWYGALRRFMGYVDAPFYGSPPVLAVLDACFLPLQVVFGGVLLASVGAGQEPQASRRNEAGGPHPRAAVVPKVIAIVGSPFVRTCAVTFLVAALLTAMWWNCVGWDLRSLVRVGALVALAVGFIAAIGGRSPLLEFLIIALGIFAGSTWVCWTSVSDTGPPSFLAALRFALEAARDLLTDVYLAAGLGVVLGAVARAVWLRRPSRAA